MSFHTPSPQEKEWLICLYRVKLHQATHHACVRSLSWKVIVFAILSVCLSGSNFPLFITAPVILDQGPTLTWWVHIWHLQWPCCQSVTFWGLGIWERGTVQHLMPRFSITHNPRVPYSISGICLSSYHEYCLQKCFSVDACVADLLRPYIPELNLIYITCATAEVHNKIWALEKETKPQNLAYIEDPCDVMVMKKYFFLPVQHPVPI